MRVIEAQAGEWPEGQVIQLFQGLCRTPGRRTTRRPLFAPKTGIGSNLSMLLIPTALYALTCGLATAQEPLLRFQHIRPENSFASASLTDVAQDRQGFLWFASFGGGFARFDGYQFRSYRYNPSDPYGLPSNLILSLYPDPVEDLLWVGTANGLVALDLRTDELTTYRHSADDPESLSHDGVMDILRDRSGSLWVATEDGLSRLDPGASGFQRYPVPAPDDLTSVPLWNWVLKLNEDRNGTLWAGTQGSGLLRYEPDSDSFRPFVHDPDDPGSLPGDLVQVIFEDREGRLWVYAGGSGPPWLTIMTDRERGRFERQIQARVGNLAEDLSGNIWAATPQGLLLHTHGTSEFLPLRHDPADSTTIGPGWINSLLVDASGVLWAPGDQISFLPPTALAFSVFRSPELGQPNPDLLVDRQGRAWISSRSGLYELDTANEDWNLHVPFPDADDPLVNVVGGFGTYQDPHGGLWVSTPGAEGVSAFDPATGEFEWREDPAFVVAMVLTSDGELWMGLHNGGLINFDFASGNMVRYRHDPNDESTLSHDFAYFILEDPDGYLWYGSQRGLNRFNRESGKARRYFSQADDHHSLSSSLIYSGMVDSRGRLWIGTAFGLNLYHPGPDWFTRFYNGDEPGPNVVDSIVESPDGTFWLGTDAGIARFDPDTGAFHNFTHADGVPAGFKGDINLGPDGMIYAMMHGGVVRVDPSLLGAEREPPRLAWTDMTIVSSEHGTRTWPAPPQHLELTHKDKLLSIGFAALDLRDPASAQYAYRLSGLHDDWLNTDAMRRSASFSELAHGDYTLELRAANEDGVWNEAGVSLAIRVLPPPWQTWWAYTLYALAGLALISTVTKWRTRSHRARTSLLETAVHERTTQLQASEAQVRRQSDELQELLELKERLFANISHEFRTPLTLMLGPIEHARQATSNPVVAAQLAMARRNGWRVLRLVDQLLELSRLSSEEVPTKKPQPVEPVANAVVEAFRPLARERGVGLSLVADDSLWTEMPTEALERVLMNLLSNAVKFTHSGGAIGVEITESADAKSVQLRVSDTGIGLPAEHQQAIFQRFQRVDNGGERVPGSGIGLALVRELVEAYGGSIEVNSEPGEGAEFIIRLPRYECPPSLRVTRDAPISEALRLEIDALEQPPAVEEVQDMDADSERAHVLVIEDNPDMRIYLRQLLSADYQVATAETGEAGLDAAEHDIPDLVICDLMLPGIDGFKVAHELRQNERTSHIPIVMLTARSDDESRLEGFREHVDDFLIKPFNDEELVLRVANLLAIRDLLRARFGWSLVAGEASGESLKEPERRFLGKLQGVLETYYMNAEFGIASMASEMAMSERQLQRKLKAVTDQTPALYLRLFRLRRSLDLLAQGHRVSEVAFDVGFSSPAYFASCFRAQFSCTPSEYQSEPSRLQV